MSTNDVTLATIDAMKAGPAMDALVAEHVMGWHVEHVQPPSGESFDNYVDGAGVGQCAPCDFSPSVDLLAAFQVIDHWDGDYEIRRQNGQFRVTLFRPSHEWMAWAETAPMAICVASMVAALEIASG